MIVEAMLVGLSFVGGSNSTSMGQFRIKERPRVVASVVERPVLDTTQDHSGMLAASILGENYAKLLSFASLEPGWDGYGGESIPSSAISLTTELLMSVGFRPGLFPTGRGSIQVEYYRDDDTFAEIEIFADHISAYCEGVNGSVEKESVSIKEACDLLKAVYGG